MKKKRTRIVNKFRFIVCLSALLVLFFTLVMSVYASVNRVEGYQEQRYIEIYVDHGDTIWSLAKEYSSEKDIRKAIYEISQLNDLDNYDIFPGQIVRIPIEQAE